MSVKEFFWLVADHEKRTQPTRSQAWAGNMTDDDVARADEHLKRLRENGK